MALDAQQLGSALNTIAFGETIKAAVRNYQKEVEDEAAQGQAAPRAVDVEELLDDPELERLHADRLAAMKEAAERRAKLEQQGHGAYTEIGEGEFLEAATKTDRLVAHFFHRDFERCKIMDAHLAKLSKKHIGTRFIKISAPDAPFFTVKLGIKMLPAVILFKGGVAVDRIVGFEPLGGKDDFSTCALERQMLAAGVLETAEQRRAGAFHGDEDSSSGEEAEVGHAQWRHAHQLAGAGPAGGAVRRGFGYARDADDESSDFDA